MCLSGDNTTSFIPSFTYCHPSFSFFLTDARTVALHPSRRSLSLPEGLHVLKEATVSIGVGRLFRSLPALVLALLVPAAAAQAQCRGGMMQGRPPQSGQGQGGLRTQPLAMLTAQPPQQQPFGLVGQPPQQQPVGLVAQPLTLKTAVQQQKELIAAVKKLQKQLKNPGLTEARRKRLKAVVAKALKKLEKHGDTLTALQ